MLSLVHLLTGRHFASPPRPSVYVMAVQVVSTLTIIGWCVYRLDQIVSFDREGNLTDPMMISGIAVSLLGLAMASFQEIFFARTLNRLRLNRFLELPISDRRSLATEIWKKHIRYSLSGGAFIAVVIFAGYYLVGYATFNSSWPLIEFWLVSTLIGFAVGNRLGASVAFANLVVQLNSRTERLRLVWGHPDGSGGVSPAGNFFTYQGTFISLIIIFLITWLILIGLFGYWADYYGFWRNHFLTLLVIATFFLVAGSLLPLWRLSRVVAQLKRRFLPALRRLETHIVKLNKRLQDSPTFRTQDAERLSTALQHLYSIDEIRQLPLTPAWRKLFRLNAALPVVGFFTDRLLAKETPISSIIGLFAGF